MGLLVGLPLKLFALLFAVLRLAWPILLALVIVWLVRRKHGGKQRTTKQENPKEPTFNGPVYTVDYEEVDEED